MAQRKAVSLVIGIAIILVPRAALARQDQGVDGGQVRSAAPQDAQPQPPGPTPAAPSVLTGGGVDAVRHFSIGGQRVLVSDPILKNLFAGINAGSANSGGDSNTFVGVSAGRVNVDGAQNSFFGTRAGEFLTGISNTVVGFAAGLGTSPASGSGNVIVGADAATGLTTGSQNVYVGATAGSYESNGSNNTAVGYQAGGSAVPQGNEGTFIGSNARLGTGSFSNATAIGANAQVDQHNSLVLGSINGVNSSTADTNVGIGTTMPAARLHVSGGGIIRARVNSNDNAGLALTLNDQPKWSVATVTGGQFQIYNDAIGQNAVWIDAATNNVGIGTTVPDDKLVVNGVLRLNSLGSAGGTQLCRNLSNQIANCSSSVRYKSNVAALHIGLELINRLRPVSFDWTQSGVRDLGLVAEEVAGVEPLLVTHDDRGEIEGVKYDRVAIVLVNAVKEQQEQIANQQMQIEAQRRAIERQQQQIEALRTLVESRTRQ